MARLLGGNGGYYEGKRSVQLTMYRGKREIQITQWQALDSGRLICSAEIGAKAVRHVSHLHPLRMRNGSGYSADAHWKKKLAGKSHDAGHMSWRELITGIYENRAQQPRIGGRPEFYPAASVGDIDDAEVSLNARLPACLRSLLLETNGVMDMMSIDRGEWFASTWLLWTVQEIVEQNDFYRRSTDDRTYDRDFRQLAFFAGAGSDGILFAFPVSEDGTCAARVVVWHPIMDELDELAPSLEDFLRGWLTTKISV